MKVCFIAGIRTQVGNTDFEADEVADKLCKATFLSFCAIEARDPGYLLPE